MGSKNNNFSGPQSRPSRVRRVTLRYQDGSWAIDAIGPAQEGIAPGSLPGSSTAEGAGTWITLSDRDGGIMYRRPIADPLGQVVEGTRDGVFTAQIVPPRNRVISILIPDIAGARVDVWMSPETKLERGGESRAAERSLSAVLPSTHKGDL